MTLITTVNATGLIDQLADEYISTYTADDLTITQIVTALLGFQVLSPAITVGTIDPVVSRSINVDGDTILRALYRLRDTVGGHIYVDADRALQWKTTIGEDKGQQIRYRKNLKGITREMDYTAMANRLYAYGAGESDARIKLSDADGHAVDYVENAAKQAEWGGIYIKVIVDKSITHPDTLLAWANLKLAELEDPRITYRVDTVDLSASDEGFSFEALQIGSTVNIIDEDLDIDISAQVVRITHPDLQHPEQMELEISKLSRDVSDTLAGIYDTQQLDQHIATTIGAGQVIVKGAFTVADWVTGGETTIVGSNIETGTITAEQIEALTITADEIAALTITADQIAANTITAGKLNVATLSAISANVGTLTSGLINGVVIYGGAGAVAIDSDGFRGRAEVDDITAFADGGGGQVEVSCAAHGLLTGDVVDIYGTTNYDGTYGVTYVDAGTFSITHSWDGDDATGVVWKVHIQITTDGVIRVGDGSLYNGEITIGGGGISIAGDRMGIKFYDENNDYRGKITGTVGGMLLTGEPIVKAIKFNPYQRLIIPVGTDMYD
jgi:phage minor structural protein